MDEFLGFIGIRNLKLDEVATGVSSRINSARGYIKDRIGQNGPLGAYLGPSTWCNKYPNASGKKQSPIDLCNKVIQYDETLKDTTFDFHYEAQDFTLLRNTGATWQLCAGENSTSYMTTSCRPDEQFKVVQIHAHWGQKEHDGAEHLIGGLGCATEIHIVHYNTKYECAATAMEHADGLLVVGIFVDEGLHNAALDPLIPHMKKISYRDEETILPPQGINIRKLIPASLVNFYTYEGSLTTPPCNECVIWIVLRGNIEASRSQLNAFRELHAVGVEDAERFPQKMIRNVRPPQELNERIVRCSFPVKPC